MLRKCFVRVSQQRLTKHDLHASNERVTEFNKVLLAKLQENFLAVPDDNFDKIRQRDETKTNLIHDDTFKDQLTDVITKGYETQDLRELDLDEIINTNNTSTNITPEKLDDFVKNVTSKILQRKNLAFQPSFTRFLQKKIDAEQLNQLATEATSKLKEQYTYTDIFNFTNEEILLGEKTTIKEHLASYDLNNMIFDHNILNFSGCKVALSNYLKSKYSTFLKTDLRKHFNQNIRALKKIQKSLKLVPTKHDKNKTIDHYVEEMLGGFKESKVQYDYTSVFVRKDLYSLMIRDPYVNRFIQTGVNSESDFISSAIIKEVPNLKNWVELICIYNPDKVSPLVIHNIQNYKNSLIYENVDNEKLCQDLQENLEYNIFLKQKLLYNDKLSTNSDLFTQFKSFLKNGLDHGVTILNDASGKELLIYPPSVLKSNTWVDTFLVKKQNEFLESGNAEGNIEYQTVMNVEEDKKVGQNYYHVDLKAKIIDDPKTIKSVPPEKLYYAYTYKNPDVSDHHILENPLRTLDEKYEELVDEMLSDENQNVKLDIDKDSENFVTQKSLVPGVILTNEYNNKSIFESKVKANPFLLDIFREHGESVNMFKGSDMRDFDVKTNSLVLSYFPYSNATKFVTVNHKKEISFNEISFLPLNVIYNLKLRYGNHRNFPKVFELDTNNVFPALVFNRKVSHLRTVPLNYDAKISHESVYTLDPESIEIENPVKVLYIRSLSEGCMLLNDKQVTSRYKDLQGTEFIEDIVNNYRLETENKEFDDNTEIAELAIKPRANMGFVNVKLPVKFRDGDNWVTDHIMVHYKLDSYNFNETSFVINNPEVEMERVISYPDIRSGRENLNYSSFQYESPKDLKKLSRFFLRNLSEPIDN